MAAALYKQALVDGRVQLVHRVRAARALGRPLPPKAVVHHADGTRRPDAPLVICPDQAYHKLLHARMRAKSAGGDPNTQRLCNTCGLVKGIDLFRLVGGGGSKCRPCRNEDRYRHRREQLARTGG